MGYVSGAPRDPRESTPWVYNAETRRSERAPADPALIKRYERELVAFNKRLADPELAPARHISFAGGDSEAGWFAKRVRVVAPALQRTLDRLDAQITRLQRMRREAIKEGWETGEAITAAELVLIASTPKAKRGVIKRDMEQRLDSWWADALDLAAVKPGSGGWCGVHGNRFHESCPACIAYRAKGLAS